LANYRNSALDLVVAFFAGCVNVFVTTPLWVANTRLKLQGIDASTENQDKDRESDSKEAPFLSTVSRGMKYSGLFDALVTIARKEGLLALYSGTLPSLILVLNPALQWSIYEFLKLHCQRWTGSQQLSAFVYFLLSAIAKFCSTVSTYPLQVIQTRMRFGFSKDPDSSSLTRVLRGMLRSGGGFRGLFKGIESKIVQTVLTSAFMIVVYEKIVAFTIEYWGIISSVRA